MKRTLIFVILMVSCRIVFAQTGDWLWAWQSVGANYYNNGKGIATDSNGNSYVTGYFKGTATFGTTSLTSYGNSDIFIVKLDTNGNFLWVQQAGNTGWDHGTSIATDSSGNCYVTGNFIDTINFGSTTLTSRGSDDVFIAKIDTNGVWVWAQQAGSISSDGDSSTGIATDSGGNCYVTGSFWGTATFGTTTINSRGQSDIFVTKIDTNGIFQWVKTPGGTSQEYGQSISADSSGNCYVTGSFYGTASFGSFTLVNGSNFITNVFVTKLDPMGNFLWAKKANGLGSVYASSIATDLNGNSYVTGSFSLNSAFGSSTLISSGNDDIYITKLDPNGNFIWAKKAGGTGGDRGTSISTDSNGNCYVTGCFSGTSEFGETSLISNGQYDIFIAMLDTNGNYLLTLQTGFMTSNDSNCITIDANGNCLITGSFNGSATFGNTTLVNNSTAYTDVFVVKYGTTYPPTVNFSADETSGLESFSVQFNDLSFAGYGVITNRLWDFGDGDTSIETNPLHVYANHGVYSVSLTVTNSCDSTRTLTRADYIQVQPRVSELALSTESLLFGNVYLGYSSSPRELWLKNTGTAPLRVDSLSFWLANTSFELMDQTLPLFVALGDSTAIRICFIPPAIVSVTDTLFIYNNSINMPRAAIRLSGTGIYVSPLPPQNIQAVMNGANAVISWDAVTETIDNSPFSPDYYIVSCNGSNDAENGLYYFQAITPDLTYTHPYVGLHAEHMFYRVRAYKNYGRNTISSLGLVEGMREEEALRLLGIDQY